MHVIPLREKNNSRLEQIDFLKPCYRVVFPKSVIWFLWKKFKNTKMSAFTPKKECKSSYFPGLKYKSFVLLL